MVGSKSGSLYDDSRLRLGGCHSLFKSLRFELPHASVLIVLRAISFDFFTTLLGVCSLKSLKANLSHEENLK